MDEFITVCPRNCYSTCTFRVQVENNKIRRILPYDSNLACPEGPCIKGLSYIERAHSEKRITYPLLKGKNGIYSRISTEEAISQIAERLSKIRNKYGSKSILWYKGSGNSGLLNETGYYFWKYFGGVTTTYGNLCWPAGLEAVRTALGSVKHNVPWDLVNAKTIIIWGKNSAETNIQEMAFIARARKNGSTIVVIDPRRTHTADKADLLFCPVPGTDAALALSIAFVLIEKGMVDRKFIVDHVTGYDEFCMNSIMPPEVAEKICGIPASEIKRLATIIGTEWPVTIIAGYGLQRYTNGGQTIRALLSLAIITGNLGKPGSGFNFANLQSCIFDNPREPLSYYPDPVKDQPFRRVISMARLGVDMLGIKDPAIKFIWVERGNPLLQSPESSKVAEAFSHSEFIVVVEQFMTDTARKADIILPGKDIFEQSDIICSYWSPYIQFKPKIVEPVGEIMPESEIYFHLAKCLGLDIPDSLIPLPGNENAEKWLKKRITGISSLSLEKLREGPVITPGLQMIAYEDMKFETPSGRIELWSGQLSERWGVLPYPVYIPLSPDTIKDDEYPLVFISPNTGSRIHSQFGNLDVIRQNSDSPALEISIRDAEDRGIKTGDQVCVFNNRGSVRTYARISGRIRQGVVVLYNGIWLEEGGGSNMLTRSLETDMGFGAAFHGQRVEVEKMDEE